MNLDYFLALSPVERVAGYLYHSAKLAMVGAKIRKNDRDDSTWTKEEDAEWEAAAEELDGWWYAMSEEEKAAIKPANSILGSIARGEWPLEP